MEWGEPSVVKALAAAKNLMKTIRRSTAAIATLALIACVLPAYAGASEPKPNVLFLAVDDMRDWVGCLGGYPGKVHTPNIDRLAQQGTLFTNAHCPSPLCGPSRAALMTGMRPSRTGLYNNNQWWLPAASGAVTIPTHFRQQGYHVVGAGKIFHHTAGNHPPNQWDDFQPIHFRNDPWFRTNRQNYPWSPSKPPPEGFPLSGVSGLRSENDWGSLTIPASDYDDAQTVDYAIDFLNRKHHKPFFLACGLFRPHLPWYVPNEYFKMYPLAEIELPPIREDDLADLPREGKKLARANSEDFKRLKETGHWKQAIRAYLASISFADAQLGRVLDSLKQSPHSNNTIVVLWSDHGWHLGEKGHWHKSTLWEAATRVPLIICSPRSTPSRCDQPVNLLDLFPTLNELCGTEPIHGLDGTSLVPLLKNVDADWDRPSVIEFQRGNAAVRSARYRYIRYRNGGEELYDHQADPHEWHNLAGQVELNDVQRDHARWLPKQWAKAAALKDAYLFDFDTFTWTNKETGKQTPGK